MREEGGEGGTFCPLSGVEVCVGQVLLSAGIEGWGDRHGRMPGDPQTWRENGDEKKRKMGFRFFPFSEIVS